MKNYFQGIELSIKIKYPQYIKSEFRLTKTHPSACFLYKFIHTNGGAVDGLMFCK